MTSLEWSDVKLGFFVLRCAPSVKRSMPRIAANHKEDACGDNRPELSFAEADDC